MIGGRTRTRTLDPLIKSQLAPSSTRSSSAAITRKKQRLEHLNLKDRLVGHRRAEDVQLRCGRKAFLSTRIRCALKFDLMCSGIRSPRIHQIAPKSQQIRPRVRPLDRGSHCVAECHFCEIALVFMLAAPIGRSRHSVNRHIRLDRLQAIAHCVGPKIEQRRVRVPLSSVDA